MDAPNSLKQLVVIILALMPVAALATSASSTNYSLQRSVIDSGGGTSISPGYTLHGTLAPAESSTSISTNYILYTGFYSISDSDNDGIFNNIDLDDDNDGLPDTTEVLLGTNLLLADTDGDGLSDFNEVNFDLDPTSYTAGIDTDPNNPDTDGDGIYDGTDLSPLTALVAGDLAPLGAPDGAVNAADYLIVTRIVLGSYAPTPEEIQRGDLYPPGAPDGVINLSDLILLIQLTL